MSLSPAASELLELLPGVLGGLTLSVVDASGRVAQRWGAADETEFQVGPGGVRAVPASGRTALDVVLPGSSGQLFATLPTDVESVSTRLLGLLLGEAAQRERIEQDLESMNASSLQLLEQVAVVGETLPRLSTGQSDAAIATMGVKAMLVAAGVERALYVHYHPETDVGEVLVHVAMDGNGQAETQPYPHAVTVPITGFLADVLRSEDEFVLRPAAAAAAEDGPRSPDGLARRQVAGVSVGYGSGERRVLLGALVVMDKCRSHYSNQQQLGSQEGQVVLSFAAMLGAVLGARKVAQLGKELSMAQTIQGQILPQDPAQVPGFEVAGDYRTSGEVGGDYFDFVRLADGRTMAVIADVSGHNLASGMIMVSARATLRTLASRCDDPARLFHELASAMHQDLERTERFFTAATAVLRPGDSQVEVVNAGHNALLLYRSERGTVQEIEGEGTIMGFLPDAGYSSQRVVLEPGDALLLYTDGVTEAVGEDEEMFGVDQLRRVLRKAGSLSARGILDAVFGAVRKFANPRLRGDDMTVVVIKAVAPGGPAA
jgi:hypothetical protein